MALPDGFNPIYHLKTVYIETHNQLVEQEFSDTGDSSWDPNFDTPRDSLRLACTITHDDSDTLMLLRLWFFYVIVRKAKAFHPYFYAIPTDNFHISVKFLPQVKLLFYESQYSASNNMRPPLEAQISYRLMVDPATMTETDVENLAIKIYDEFASNGNIYSFDKGQYKASYRDKANGYQFILTVNDETTARDLITKVLSLNNHVPDWDFLTISESKKQVSQTPEQITIIGKNYDKPIYRQDVTVHFRKAELAIWGMRPDKLLVCKAEYVDRPVYIYF